MNSLARLPNNDDLTVKAVMLFGKRATHLE